MTEERPEEEPLDEQLPAPTDVPRYYVNFVRATGNAIDFGIDLGRRDESGIEWLAQLRMPWEEALVVYRIIEHAVGEYERGVGPIRDLTGMPQQAEEVNADDDVRS